MNGAYDNDAVNIYYANSATCGGLSGGEAGGLSCQNDRKVAFVYAIGGTRVLVHELGHALLGPAHWDPAVGADNIMCAGSSPGGPPLNPRSSVSAGQAIFMNYDKDSVLNTLGKAPGLTFTCQAECPSILIDPSWGSCDVKPTANQTVTDPLHAWFECVECTNGELAAVLTGVTEARLSQLIEALRPVAATVAEVAAPARPDVEAARRANDVARHQRRALFALAALAAKKNPGAAVAIRQAYGDRQRYRPDVSEAIDGAFRRIQ
jgi:hypothetical protein